MLDKEGAAPLPTTSAGRWQLPSNRTGFEAMSSLRDNINTGVSLSVLSSGLHAIALIVAIARAVQV